MSPKPSYYCTPIVGGTNDPECTKHTTMPPDHACFTSREDCSTSIDANRIVGCISGVLHRDYSYRCQYGPKYLCLQDNTRTDLKTYPSLEACLQHWPRGTTAHAAPHAAPHTTPHVTPHAAPHAAPHATPHVTPHAAPHAAPHVTPHTTPHVTPHAAPHAAPHVTPHAAPHVTPHAASHAAPHAAPHVTPHATPHAAPHAAPHVTPHATPHAAPHVTPHATPHAAPHDASNNGVSEAHVIPYWWQVHNIMAGDSNSPYDDSTIDVSSARPTPDYISSMIANQTRIPLF